MAERDKSSQDQHVMPYSGKWAVKASGSDDVSFVFENKDEAVDKARQLAEELGGELIIHREDGSIQGGRESAP